LLFGNVYIYFAWGGKEYINSKMRITLFTGFAVLCGLGCFVFAVFKADSRTEEEKEEQEELIQEKSEQSAAQIAISSIIESFQLMVTKEIMLISNLFLYSGLFFCFYAGVFSTAIGNSKLLESPMSTVGLCGIFIGVGEILGGGMFSFGSKLMDKIPKSVILVL